MNPVFISRYRILDELGRGGMGIVYKAEDPRLERLVALKTLPPKLVHNKEALRRFLREARVAAKLDHPNIIPIYDVGEDNGIYFMVMEYLEGETLRDWLEAREKIDFPSAFHLFKQVALALDYAHRHKVIHRDVKPENIMVLRNETVKVMDFGIAVMDDRHSVTQAGAVLGTIAYVSPEQAKGQSADARSDIYSLGIILYELVTGELPFQAATPSEMLAHHLSTPPPSPSRRNARVSKKLDRIVLKTLHKEPEERYQSVAALLHDLEEAFQGGQAEFLASPSERTRFQSSDLPMPAPASPSLADADKTAIVEELKALLSPKPVESVPAPAEDLSRDSFARYRPLVEKIQRDLAALSEGAPEARARPGKVLTPCARCGAENDVTQKYCSTCGSLLVSSEVVSQKTGLEQALKLYRTRQYPEALQAFREILKKDPQAGEAQLYAGLCFLQLERYREALAAFRQATDLDPHHAVAWEGLGDAASRLSHDLEALQAYQQAVRLVSSPGLYLKLGTTQEALGNLEEARRAFSRALQLDPDNHQTLKKLARLYIKLGQFDAALEAVRQLIDLSPNDSEAHRMLGEIYESTNRYGQALQAYEKSLALSPRDSKSLERMGDLHDRQNRTDLAIHHLSQAAEAEPQNPEVHAKLADLYLKQNQDKVAITHLERAAEISPNEPQFHKDLGKLYLKQNDLEKAMIQLEWTIALDPADPEAHSRLGQIYYKKDQTQLSIREYKTAIHLDPYNPEFHESLGMLYYVEEDFEPAIEEMQRAVTLDPGNVDYRKALGVMYESKGKLDLARKEYQKAVETAPEDALAQGLLGRIYSEQNLVHLAIYQFQKSLELEPRSHLVHNLLGKAFLKLGSHDQAIEAFRKALELAPKPVNARARQIVGRNTFYLGQSLFEKGAFKEAADLFAQVTQLLPEFADAFHYWGKAQFRLGDRPMAVQLLERACQLSGNDARLFADLAEMDADSQNTEGAIQALSRAVQLAPDEARYHAFLGDLHARQKNLEEAVRAYQQALKWEKSKKDIYHGKLGSLYFEQKNYGEAAVQLKAAILLSPDNWHYHRELARTYEAMGKIQQALEELEKAKGQGPDASTLSLIQEEIERLSK